MLFPLNVLGIPRFALFPQKLLLGRIVEPQNVDRNPITACQESPNEEGQKRIRSEQSPLYMPWKLVVCFGCRREDAPLVMWSHAELFISNLPWPHTKPLAGTRQSNDPLLAAFFLIFPLIMQIWPLCSRRFKWIYVSSALVLIGSHFRCVIHFVL
jgi:hypothetical protein